MARGVEGHDDIEFAFKNSFANMRILETVINLTSLVAEVSLVYHFLVPQNHCTSSTSNPGFVGLNDLLHKTEIYGWLPLY